MKIVEFVLVLENKFKVDHAQNSQQKKTFFSQLTIKYKVKFSAHDSLKSFEKFDSFRKWKSHMFLKSNLLLTTRTLSSVIEHTDENAIQRNIFIKSSFFVAKMIILQSSMYSPK